MSTQRDRREEPARRESDSEGSTEGPGEACSPATHLASEFQLGGTVSGPACRGENLWAAVLQDVYERRALFRECKLIEELEARSREV